MESSVQQATFGKMLFQMQVTDAAGKRLTLWRSMLRQILKPAIYFLALIAFLLFLIPGQIIPQFRYSFVPILCALVTILTIDAAHDSKRKLCLHDRIAKTYVIRRRKT